MILGIRPSTHCTITSLHLSYEKSNIKEFVQFHMWALTPMSNITEFNSLIIFLIVIIFNCNHFWLFYHSLYEFRFQNPTSGKTAIKK